VRQSSDRIPKWLLPVVRHQLANGGEIRRSAGVVASWARYAEGVDEQGEPIEVVDRLADSLTHLARCQREDPDAFIANRDLFGTWPTISVSSPPTGPRWPRCTSAGHERRWSRWSDDDTSPRRLPDPPVAAKAGAQHALPARWQRRLFRLPCPAKISHREVRREYAADSLRAHVCAGQEIVCWDTLVASCDPEGCWYERSQCGTHLDDSGRGAKLDRSHASRSGLGGTWGREQGSSRCLVPVPGHARSPLGRLLSVVVLIGLVGAWPWALWPLPGGRSLRFRPSWPATNPSDMSVVTGPVPVNVACSLAARKTGGER